MLEQPVYGQRYEVMAVPGYATASSVQLLVISKVDPSATTLTVTIPGSFSTTYTAVTAAPGVGQFLMSQYAIDTLNGPSPPRFECWTGVINVTGLDAFTRYTWSIAQGTDSADGSFMSAPSATDDFAMYFVTCDNNTHYTNFNNANPHRVPGHWQYIKRYYDEGALPLAGIVHIDDHGYIDLCAVDDRYDGTASGFNASKPQTSNVDCVWAFAWMTNFGMWGPDSSPTGDEMVAAATAAGRTPNEYLRCIWGREENRNFCKRNINLFPQWGDHEFINDIGWDNDVTAGGNNRWSTYPTVDGIGKEAWDAFYGLIQPPDCNSHTNDANSNHWSMNFGPLLIAATDGISQSTGLTVLDYTPSTPTDPKTHEQMGVGVGSGVSAFLGTGQIDDIIEDTSTSTQSFKFIFMPHGLKYCADGTVNEFSYLAQHPLYNHQTTEYGRLFTNTVSGKSIMGNANTNGTHGTTVVFSGDIHRPTVQRHMSKSYTGNHEEVFEHWQMGSVNGSTPQTFNNLTNLDSGDRYASANLEAVVDVLWDYGKNILPDDFAQGAFSAIRAEVYGSANPPEVHLYLENAQGDVFYSAKYVQHGLNRSIPVSDSQNNPSGVFGGAD